MMNKKATTSLTEEIIKNTHLARIFVDIYRIVGFPTETEENFKETLDFIAKNKDFIDHIPPPLAGCVVLFGSDIYNNPNKYGLYWPDEKKLKIKDTVNWYSKETNPETRTERLKVLIEYCKSLNINLIPSFYEAIEKAVL